MSSRNVNRKNNATRPKKAAHPKPGKKNNTRTEVVRRQPRMDFAGNRSQVNGVISNQNELRYSFTDYFDWPLTELIGETPTPIDLPVTYEVDRTDTMFGETAIPTAVEVDVLPRSNNAQNADSIFMFLGSVPTYELIIGDSTVSDTTSEFGVVNTVVKPDFNVKWQRVARWDFLKMFRDSNVTPLPDVGSGQFKVLFRMQLVNPDDYSAYGDLENKVQIRVTTTYKEVCPVSQKSNVRFTPSSFNSLPDSGHLDPVETPVQVRLKSIANNIR